MGVDRIFSVIEDIEEIRYNSYKKNRGLTFNFLCLSIAGLVCPVTFPRSPCTSGCTFRPCPFAVRPLSWLGVGGSGGQLVQLKTRQVGQQQKHGVWPQQPQHRADWLRYGTVVCFLITSVAADSMAMKANCNRATCRIYRIMCSKETALKLYLLSI